jgi:primosomal protein N' (replication factor Y)
MYLDVAVCVPLPRTFVYKTDEPVEVGCRVVVPFRKRDVEGFVVGLRNEAPDVEVLPLQSIMDSSPLLRPDIFELCRWISSYYASPLGEVLKGALPPGISAKHIERGPSRGTRGPPPRPPALARLF